jgi:hypothetical protein
LVSDDKGGEGTAEEESQGTAEQAAEQAARGTAVSGDGGLQAEMREKSETWEDVFFQVKKARGISQNSRYVI